MSWLRIDDSFADHPKILGLTLKQRWTWLNVLCYCARFDTEGVVPTAIGEAIAGASPAFTLRCIELGLLEQNGSQYHVHDWAIYNAKTTEERVAYYLSRNPDASANDVFKAIGGKRELVLATVNQYRSGTQNGTGAGSQGGTREPEKVVPELVHGPYPGTTEGSTVSDNPTVPVPSNGYLQPARGPDLLIPTHALDDLDFLP